MKYSNWRVEVNSGNQSVPFVRIRGQLGAGSVRNVWGVELFCDKCCVQMHAYHPLHNIEVSIGYFSLTTLVLTKTSAG